MSKDISQEQKNIFANNLNRLLSETGKTQSDLVTRFGITASTVSDWCNAKKYPRVDKMQMLADYFGVKKSDLTEKQKSLDEVLEEYLRIFSNMAKEDVPFCMAIPVYRYVKLIGDELSFEDYVRHTFVDIDDLENHVALLIPNDDLEPEFSSNDIAIIKKQKEFKNKKYYYLLINNKATIRKVIFSSNDEQVILKADNPKLDILILSKSEITIIGEVVIIQKNKKL